MPIALKIAQFAFAFMDKVPALISAGVDITAAYSAHKSKVTQLATAGLAPTPKDWEEMHAALKPLEDSIQAAHR